MIAAILKFLPDWVKLPVAACTGAALMFYPARWYGASQEKSSQETQALTKTVQVLRERNIVDAQVSNSSSTDVCRFMGLSAHDTAECVRRMEEADPERFNGSDDYRQGPEVCGPSVGSQPVRGLTGVLETSTK